MSDDFDWNTAIADGYVPVPDQAAIACYTNRLGKVVLRQEGRYPEGDIWIVCDPIHVVALAKELLRAAGRTDLVIGPVSQIEVVGKDSNRPVIPQRDFAKSDLIDKDLRAEERQNGKDRTAAEGKRRQRQRERDGNANADVTPAGHVTVTPESVTGRVVPIAPRLFEQESEPLARTR